MKDVNLLTSNGVNVEQSLELFGDMEMYDETVADFLELVDQKLANLEKFKSASDMPNYAIEVHSLKSDARYLGFTSLADVCYQSELKSKAGDLMFVQTNHPVVLAEAKKMIALSQRYLGLPVTVEEPQGVAPTQVMQQPAQMTAPTQVMQQPAQTVIQPQNVAPTIEFLPNNNMSSPTIEFLPNDNNINNQPVTQLGNSVDDYFAQAQVSQEPVQISSAPKAEAILVIDDSTLVANFVKKIFESKYDVILANDGQSGINVVNSPEISRIKCILLDLNMPNVDGFAVLEYFKQNGIFVKTPVSIISGAEDTESMDRARQYPIIDILAKPFNERDVQRIVEMSLATYF